MSPSSRLDALPEDVVRLIEQHRAATVLQEAVRRRLRERERDVVSFVMNELGTQRRYAKKRMDSFLRRALHAAMAGDDAECRRCEDMANVWEDRHHSLRTATRHVCGPDVVSSSLLGSIVGGLLW